MTLARALEMCKKMIDFRVVSIIGTPLLEDLFLFCIIQEKPVAFNGCFKEGNFNSHCASFCAAQSVFQETVNEPVSDNK